MVNLKTYQDYDKFLANMQSEIDRHKPSVPLVASNYADWQPQLKYDVEDSDIKDVLVRYSQEYSVVNHSDRLGSPSDIFSSYYEEGQRPSGFATKIVPQRPEYGNLRGQILALADQIRSMGFEVKDIRVEDRMIHDPNQGYPTHKMILFDVWNEAIEEQRDIMYHLNEPAFRREQAAEQAAERAYEENWHRQNGGPTIPDYDERSLMPDIQEQHTTLAFDKIAMLKDDEGKWALFMKPENEKSLSVYPTKEDVSKYFATVKKGDADASERMRLLMASKYYVMATENPSLKVDLFKSQASPETLAKIDRVNIFKNKESRLLLMPTINGEKLKPREISPGQWQRMWLAEDMQDYKKHLAATVFADVLTEGKDKSLSSESPSPTIQSHSEGKNQSVSSDSPATSPKISPLVKQYLDLKAKHPDVMLLFRTGDFYETYKEDAENASKILGITLTRSSKTKDEQGKPLTMAGFPYHALDSYLPKLIRAGQRIAICDQIEAPHQTAKQGLAESAAPASVMAKQKEVISKAGPLAQEYNLTKTRSGWTIQPPGFDTPIGLARIDAAKLERDPSIFSDLVKNYENPQSRSQHL